jgi:hypothetical protein
MSHAEERSLVALGVAFGLALILWAGIWSIEQYERLARERRERLPRRPPLRRGYDD